MTISRYVLFCNDGFGKSFELALREWAARQRVEYIVVRSAKRTFKGSTIRVVVQRLIHRLRLARKNFRHRSSRMKFAFDVNEEDFINGLTRGANTVALVAGFNQIFQGSCIG